MTTEQYRELLGCEHAEISTYPDRMFLKIGKTRNTRENARSYWMKDGKRIDFEYIDWTVVASGANDEGLEASAREYKRLRGLTWEQYFADHVDDPDTKGTGRNSTKGSESHSLEVNISGGSSSRQHS